MKRLPKNVAIGYLVNDNSNFLIRYSWVLLFPGTVTAAIGLLALKEGVYFPLILGVVLTLVGFILFINYGTSVITGKLFLYPDELIIIPKKEPKKNIKRKDVKSAYFEISSFEGESTVTWVAPGANIPVMEEGNRNYIRIELEMGVVEYRFQIKHSSMFRKFKSYEKLWVC